MQTIKELLEALKDVRGGRTDMGICPAILIFFDGSGRILENGLGLSDSGKRLLTFNDITKVKVAKTVTFKEDK